MQDQPQAGDAREDSDVQMEFYEQLARDDQEQLGEEMAKLENDPEGNATFGERIGSDNADPFMADTPQEDLR